MNIKSRLALVVLAGLIGLIFSSVVPAAAQNPPGVERAAAGPGRITGQVTDPEGRPLETVAITVRAAADSALVTGTLTDASGRFRITGLAPGRYRIRVGMIGYRPRTSEAIELTADSPAAELGVIRLEAMALEVEGVEAVAERAAVVVEADRTVYNASGMPVASAGTATDVLRAVPELEVDVDNNVKLRGNQPVAVHLNGRPLPLSGEQLANFLQQLPGDRIERVEVMPNPSARHDPEGMGGIVNIVLKENTDLGLSGSLSANTSTRNRQYANGRLNYQRGRLTLFSGLGGNLFRNEFRNYDLRENLVAAPVTIVEQDGVMANRSRGWHADWTAELRVGRQATLWSNAWMFGNFGESDGTTNYGILHEDHAVRDRYDHVTAGTFSFANYNLGLGFKQVFQPQKEELTVDGRVTRGGNDNDMDQRRVFHIQAGEPAELPPELTLNAIDAGNRALSIQTDYFRPVRGAKLEIGYRASKREQDNENDLRIYVTEAGTDPRERTRSGYDFAETFHSLYGTLGGMVGRFGVQGGVRAEFTATRFESRVEEDSFDRSYHSIFPSFNVSYSPKQGETLRVLYARRISRPHPMHLDPFVPSTDPLNRFYGNPELRPSYTQSVTVDYSRTAGFGTVRIAPYWRETTDIWERIRTVDDAGVATSRWENAAVARALGANLTVSFSPGGRVSGSANVNVYQDARDGSNIGAGYHRTATLWSMGGNVAIRLSPTLSAQMFGNHFPTQSILQGRASGYTFTSISVRRQIGDRKGSISLNVMDPFNLYRYTSSSRDATYVQRSRSSATMRVATLGFSYNFGRPPQQQSRRAADQDEGETIRVR